MKTIKTYIKNTLPTKNGKYNIANKKKHEKINNTTNIIIDYNPYPITQYNINYLKYMNKK